MIGGVGSEIDVDRATMRSTVLLSRVTTAEMRDLTMRAGDFGARRSVAVTRAAKRSFRGKRRRRAYARRSMPARRGRTSWYRALFVNSLAKTRPYSVLYLNLRAMFPACRSDFFETFLDEILAEISLTGVGRLNDARERLFLAHGE